MPAALPDTKWRAEKNRISDSDLKSGTSAMFAQKLYDLCRLEITFLLPVILLRCSNRIFAG